MCHSTLLFLEIYPKETFTHFKETHTKKIITELVVIVEKSE